MVSYHFLTHPEELAEVPDLEMLVWGMGGRDTVPTHMLQAILHSGGSLIGAYDERLLVGFALALLARRDDQWLVWSHMAGVHPDYQSKGLGFGLKQQQRSWALGQGYRLMSWTYDPLLRPNANFNMRHLGARSSIYHVNYYGTMQDGINAGLPSDRLEVDWMLDSERVIQHAAGYIRPLTGISPDAPLCLATNAKGEPILNLQFDDQPWLRVEIPENLAAMKRQDMGLALAWRMALREVLQLAFAMNYEICDFQRLTELHPHRGSYLLCRKESL